MNSLSRKCLGEYWIESGNSDLLETSFKKLPVDSYSSFLNDGILKIKMSNTINFDEINSNNESFWTLALHAGYLTRMKDT